MPLIPFASSGSWQPRSRGFRQSGSPFGRGFNGALQGATYWHYAAAIVAVPLAWLGLWRSASLRLMAACAGDRTWLMSRVSFS
jgi:hypothetical protein